MSSALTLAASGVLLAVPAGLAFGMLWALGRGGVRGLGAWAAVPAAVVFTLGAVVVLWPAVGWLGRGFERTDPVETAA